MPYRLKKRPDGKYDVQVKKGGKWRKKGGPFSKARAERWIAKLRSVSHGKEGS